MLTAEKNRLLTEVGPGKPMGDLLRRYWHPIAGVGEFETKSIKPMRLFGEDLVLFRTLKGDYGLVSRKCVHRGSDLTFGIVEEDGIRCGYHGWQYDKAGVCVFRPFEAAVNPQARLPSSVKLAAYQVQAKAGMLWAYMGPQPAPLLPDWETFNWPNCHAQAVMAEIPCNWLQCQENTVDPVHFEWMHDNWSNRLAGCEDNAAKHLKLKFEEFPHGFTYKRVREGQTVEVRSLSGETRIVAPVEAIWSSKYLPSAELRKIA